MTPLPPPLPGRSGPDGPPPPTWPASAPTNAHRRVSRRVLLLSAGGAVLTAGGVAAWISRSGGPSAANGTPPSSADTAAPATTDGVTPPSTAPATTASPSATTTPSTPTAVTPSDRVLVVVQMSGGNDALNTLVPITGTYHDLRPSLGLADDTLIALPGETGYGLHPSLAPLAPLLDTGELGVLAGVGFPDPDRSHFAALDMWWSATPGQTFRTGWLGRWLDAAATPDDVVLRSTGLGGAVPALQAERSASVGVNSLSQFVLPDIDPSVLTAWTSLAPEHAAAASAVDVMSALDLSWLADEQGDAQGDGQDAGQADDDSVVARLAAAAELIATEPGVRVVFVSTSGFDTHADQLAVQARLLDELATGIARFRRRLDESGDADRVLLVTTSEFGRRVQENGSGGTDHGKGGMAFVVGSRLTAGAIVVHGSIDPSDTDDGDLRPVVDPRSLYATALDWLGPDSGLTDAVLGGTFERLPWR
ncbi:MAG: DUF1501 domain-containing protein [Acidimicrobiales bacterium]